MRNVFYDAVYLGILSRACFISHLEELAHGDVVEAIRAVEDNALGVGK